MLSSGQTGFVSLTFRVAENDPATDGWNETAIWQDAPGARFPQLLAVIEKALAPLPLIMGFEIVWVTPTAVLLTVKVIDLAPPGETSPKFPADGENRSWQGHEFTATIAPVAPAERTVT